MNGFIKIYTSINNLYEFRNGDSGYGYIHKKDIFNIEILVPIDRIVISDAEELDNYCIKWY